MACMKAKIDVSGTRPADVRVENFFGNEDFDVQTDGVELEAADPIFNKGNESI
jgi:hypothetical protein